MSFILTFFLCVQLLDLHNVMMEKHHMMQTNAREESLLQDETLQKIAQNSDYLLEDHFEDHTNHRKIAVWAYKNGMQTYFTVATVGRVQNCNRLTEQTIEEIRQTGNIAGYVVATTDEETAERYLAIPQVDVYRYDNIYFAYNKDI